MNKPENDPAWEAATWEGNRRAQLRRALRRTVRERLEALEALSETSARLAALGRAARQIGSSPSQEPARGATAEVREPRGPYEGDKPDD